MAFECVKIEWQEPEHTTFEVLSESVYLTSPNVVGLVDDIEYLVKHADVIPEYDPLTQRLVTSKDLVDTVDPTYPPLRQWVVTHSLIDKTDSEVKREVNNIENEANLDVFPMYQWMKFQMIYSYATMRITNGDTVPQPILDLIPKYEQRAVSAYQNYLNSLDKKDDIDLGNPIDFDSGWETTNPNPDD